MGICAKVFDTDCSRPSDKRWTNEKRFHHCGLLFMKPLTPYDSEVFVQYGNLKRCSPSLHKNALSSKELGKLLREDFPFETIRYHQITRLGALLLNDLRTRNQLCGAGKTEVTTRKKYNTFLNCVSDSINYENHIQYLKRPRQPLTFNSLVPVSLCSILMTILLGKYYTSLIPSVGLKLHYYVNI